MKAKRIFFHTGRGLLWRRIFACVSMSAYLVLIGLTFYLSGQPH